MKLTKEEQDKADKEQQENSEENAKKNKDHIKCVNSNKRRHDASECPEKKPKGSSGRSSGGFAMMCFEVNYSPVERDSDQTSVHHTEQPHLEEKNPEIHSEVCLEESLRRACFRRTTGTKSVPSTLQNWLNRESQLHVSECQSHVNELRLEQSQEQKKMTFLDKGHEAKGLMNQKLDDIKSKMEEDEMQDEDGNEDDHKPAARVKSQDDDDVSDYEEEPSNKKRRKESLSSDCEVLQQHM